VEIGRRLQTLGSRVLPVLLDIPARKHQTYTKSRMRSHIHPHIHAHTSTHAHAHMCARGRGWLCVWAQ